MTLSSEAIELLAEALAIDPSDVTDQTALGTTPQWDSLAHMRLILALENRLGRPLGAEAIVSLISAAEVEALMVEG